MNRIIVCDDEAQFADVLKRLLEGVSGLRDDFEIIELAAKELRDAVAALELRRRSARPGASDKKAMPWGEHPFDAASVLIVDYDLVNLSEDSYITGEGVAYLARCYSNCGAIVALNQYGRGNSFDLTLKGHPNSYADLNISAEQLKNRGLWSTEWDEFRPWYWPCIPNLAASIGERAADVDGKMNTTLAEFFSLPDSVVDNLSRASQSFVLGKLGGFSEVTFSAFLQDSGQGLKGRDVVFDVASEARIVASRVGKWLDCLVLRGQDVLVDAPNLAQRCPSLIDGNPNDPAILAALASFGDPQKLPLKHDLIAHCEFSRAHWLSRMAWMWPEVEKMDAIPEIAEPWSNPPLDKVFCEDSSSFRKREEAQDFVADLPSSYVRRFVTRPQFSNVDYQPRVRFTI